MARLRNAPRDDRRALVDLFAEYSGAAGPLDFPPGFFDFLADDFSPASRSEYSGCRGVDTFQEVSRVRVYGDFSESVDTLAPPHFRQDCLNDARTQVRRALGLCGLVLSCQAHAAPKPDAG